MRTWGYFSRIFATRLFEILFDESAEFDEILLFCFLHLFPKHNGVGVTLCLFDIIPLDTPERFVLLNVLLHEIIEMVVFHGECIMAINAIKYITRHADFITRKIKNRINEDSVWVCYSR